MILSCDKHELSYYTVPVDECPVCVREERDRLRQERDDAWDLGHIAGREKSPTMRENRALREERDALSMTNAQLHSQLDEAKRLLRSRMHCDICECHGCLEVRKVLGL